MKPKIFVSYARQDHQIADKIIEQLGRLGVSTWSDRDISAGANWSAELKRAFEESETVLFLLSPNSLSSVFVSHEVNLAIAQGKSCILPVLVGEVDTSAIPQALQKYQWLDLRHGDEHAIRRLAAIVGQVPGASAVDTARKNKGYVFLSYAEEDGDFVGELKEFLKGKGYGYWDFEESDRDYHNQLFLELEEVIMGSTALFAILSEHWKRSRWTVREYFFAEDASIPIFLLRAKALSPTLAIAGIPYIDFTSDTTRGFEKLNHELERKGL